jgi:hypothetical protein
MKRGRPPKPPEYWADLARLKLPGRPKTCVLDCGGTPKEFVIRPNKSLLQACRQLIAKYRVVKWCDPRTDKPLWTITDAATLRTRIIEARRRIPGPLSFDTKIKITWTNTFRSGTVLISTSTGTNEPLVPPSNVMWTKAWTTRTPPRRTVFRVGK